MNHPTQISDELTRVSNLRSQHGTLLGTTGGPVELSWRIETQRLHASQLAFQIQASTAQDFSSQVTDSGVTLGSDQIGVVAPGAPLASREIRHYRIRIQTEHGWTAWSLPATVEAGLLEATDWIAEFIGDDGRVGSPSPTLRREFVVTELPVSARLYVSSMGLNEVQINGVKVGDGLLNPGWTVYQERILVDTYNVTSLINVGDNAISAELSDGWWRGRFGFKNRSENYGTDIGLIAQLELRYADGSLVTVASDGTWKVSTGEILASSIYDGSTIDQTKLQTGWRLPGFDDSKWKLAAVKTQAKHALKPRTTAPVRAISSFPMTVDVQPDRTLLRGTQNVSGWVRLTVEGVKGQKVTVRHAEVLEPGDKLHTKALRSAKATDVYVLGFDGRHVLEPRFTFHGFQYADVVTEAVVISAEAIAISSDNERRGMLRTSDTRLNRLHDNVLWSQYDNFVSLPTDCPQRDERLGWTGDAQAFAAASNTLLNTQAFWRSWLIDVELDQYENGDVGAVVPDLLKLDPNSEIGDWILEGRAGWADAATIVPMSLYEYFADKSVLSTQLNSMRRWTDALHNRREGEKFLPTEFQFGDWCDPDAPGDRPWESKVSADFVANAFFAHTADLMAQAESLVGSQPNASKYQAMANQLKHDIWAIMGEEAKTTTAGCAMALEFGIVPEEERKTLAAHLASMVKSDAGKITTGFLGTPLILHALSKNGHADAAYTMLMRRDFRSWLYAVDKGATSMWERWDAIREDGSIHTGDMDTDPEGQEDASMISFNHYAYGAVVDWMYRNVGGLAPEIANPGYRVVSVAPIPASGITFSAASIQTGFGEVSLAWELTQQGDFVAKLEVPFGSQARLELPVSSNSSITCNGEICENDNLLSHGSYILRVTNPEIVSYR
jgi:alpha-L-rhamnosidase